MRPEVARDLQDSTRIFARVIWPVLGPRLGGGNLVPMEGVADSRFAREVDLRSGVDAWQIVSGTGMMRGIASRVQYGRAWASFTIRDRRVSGADTEVAKRIEALRRKAGGWLVPALTIHGYVTSRNDPELLCAYAIRTEDLYGFIQAGVEGEDFNRVTNRSDGVQFLAVWVKHLKEAGIRVVEEQSASVIPFGPRPRRKDHHDGLPPLLWGRP